MSRSRPRSLRPLSPRVDGLEPRSLLSVGAPPMGGAEVRTLVAEAVAPARRLFIQPEAGRGPILEAIRAARSEIRVGICNLSDPEVGDALIQAVGRGVRVRVILDRADYLAKPPEQQEAARLRAGGVEVHLSNPVFPQSFPKYILIDQRRVVIMTLCIVPPTFEDTRDYGVSLRDPRVFREVESLFRTDWAASAPPGVTPPATNPTPPIRDPRLIVSPTNAIAQLSRLITSARRTLDVTTEVVDDAFLEGQLVAAVERGVRVRLIAPVVSRAGQDNTAGLRFLAARGVQVHVTTRQYPDPGGMPYMHAKSMVVDGRTTYLGSIDLDATETSRDRELGIILRLPGVTVPVRAQFGRDWLRTGPLPVATGPRAVAGT